MNIISRGRNDEVVARLRMAKETIQVVGLSYELQVQSGLVPDDDGSITDDVNKTLKDINDTLTKIEALNAR